MSTPRPTVPSPSAWRYEHQDQYGRFVAYQYDTVQPKNCNHPNYVPMYTLGQLMQTLNAKHEELEEALSYADACRAQAHRLALELECLLMDTKDLSVVSKWWDSAHEALEGWHTTMRAQGTSQPADLSDNPLIFQTTRDLTKERLCVL